MSVSEQDVDRVAELANLELTSGEKAAILRVPIRVDHFAQLNQSGHHRAPMRRSLSDDCIRGACSI